MSDLFVQGSATLMLPVTVIWGASLFLGQDKGFDFHLRMGKEIRRATEPSLARLSHLSMEL